MRENGCVWGRAPPLFRLFVLSSMHASMSPFIITVSVLAALFARCSAGLVRQLVVQCDGVRIPRRARAVVVVVVVVVVVGATTV